MVQIKISACIEQHAVKHTITSLQNVLFIDCLARLNCCANKSLFETQPAAFLTPSVVERSPVLVAASVTMQS